LLAWCGSATAHEPLLEVSFENSDSAGTESDHCRTFAARNQPFKAAADYAHAPGCLFVIENFHLNLMSFGE
jgi:hypothetical protein